LWALARAADGSMRDALSLTDQAIAHGDGKLTEAEVSTMLGTIDLTAIADIARALVNNDGTEVLAVVQKMSEHAPDYNAALADLLSVWHRVAIAQTVPDALDNRHGDYQLIQELSKALSKEDVQLFYQTVLLGRRDLPLAPDPKTGFEMVMLRMLAFQPARENRIDPPVAPPEAKIASGDVPIPAVEEGVFDPLKKPEPAMPEVAAMVGADIQESTTKDDVQYGTQGSTQDSTQEKGLTVSTVDTSEYEPSEYEEFAALTETRRDKLNISVPEDVSVGPGIQLPVQEPAVDVLHQSDEPLTAQDIQVLSQEIHQHEVHQSEIPQQETLQQETPQEDGLAPTCSFNELIPEKWIEIYQGLSVGGVLQNVAANLALVEVRGNILRFDLDIANSSLYEEGHQQRLADTLSEYFGQPVGVDIEVGAVAMETPQANRLRKREERQAAALDSLKHDPNVRRVMDVFGGVLLEKTVKPID